MLGLEKKRLQRMKERKDTFLIFLSIPCLSPAFISGCVNPHPPPICFFFFEFSIKKRKTTSHPPSQFLVLASTAVKHPLWMCSQSRWTEALAEIVRAFSFVSVSDQTSVLISSGAPSAWRAGTSSGRLLDTSDVNIREHRNENGVNPRLHRDKLTWW